MIKLGLTGGIGSGKTYVSKIFEAFGIPVYYADDRSKYLLNNSPKLILQVKDLFGANAYVGEKLNNRFIASIVFNDKSKLESLNNIAHPAVEADFMDWCKKYRDKVYVIKEAAILFESNAYSQMDKNILVVAPLETRLSRVINRDGVLREQVMERINNQWPTDKIMPLADFIVKNDDKNLILPQILDIDNKIRIEWQNLVSG